MAKDLLKEVGVQIDYKGLWDEVHRSLEEYKRKEKLKNEKNKTN